MTSSTGSNHATRIGILPRVRGTWGGTSQLASLTSLLILVIDDVEGVDGRCWFVNVLVPPAGGLPFAGKPSAANF